MAVRAGVLSLVALALGAHGAQAGDEFWGGGDGKRLSPIPFSIMNPDGFYIEHRVYVKAGDTVARARGTNEKGRLSVAWFFVGAQQRVQNDPQENALFMLANEMRVAESLKKAKAARPEQGLPLFKAAALTESQVRAIAGLEAARQEWLVSLGDVLEKEHPEFERAFYAYCEAAEANVEKSRMALLTAVKDAAAGSRKQLEEKRTNYLAKLRAILTDEQMKSITKQYVEDRKPNAASTQAATATATAPANPVNRFSEGIALLPQKPDGVYVSPKVFLLCKSLMLGLEFDVAAAPANLDELLARSPALPMPVSRITTQDAKSAMDGMFLTLTLRKGVGVEQLGGVEQFKRSVRLQMLANGARYSKENDLTDEQRVKMKELSPRRGAMERALTSLDQKIQGQLRAKVAALYTAETAEVRDKAAGALKSVLEEIALDREKEYLAQYKAWLDELENVLTPEQRKSLLTTESVAPAKRPVDADLP